MSKLTAGLWHSAVLTEAGVVHTFGWNELGQLGHGDDDDRLEPTAVAGLAGDEVTEVAAGTYHTAVRLASGELRAIGKNTSGQLGDGEEGRWLEAVPVPVAPWKRREPPVRDALCAVQ